MSTMKDGLRGQHRGRAPMPWQEFAKRLARMGRLLFPAERTVNRKGKRVTKRVYVTLRNAEKMLHWRTVDGTGRTVADRLADEHRSDPSIGRLASRLHAERLGVPTLGQRFPELERLRG